MRFLSLLVVLLASSAVAQDTVIVSRRPVTVVQSSAQDAAVVLARRGTLVHTGCGQTEGIGFLMAQAVFAGLPVFILYLFFQRHIINAVSGRIG